MLRLVLRLWPSAGRACARALPSGPAAALGSRIVPGTSCLRRLHSGVGSRNVFLFSSLSHRGAFLRYPQLTATCQSTRFYSLPPHQKVTKSTGFQVSLAPVQQTRPPGLTSESPVIYFFQVKSRCYVTFIY